MSCKLALKGLGLYRITYAVNDKSTYMLEKLDGLKLAGIFTGNKLKKFHSRH